MGADVTQAMEILKRAGTGVVSDALGLSGIRGDIVGVRPARGFEDHPVVGPAVTIEFGPGEPSGPKYNNYKVIRESAPGSVLVIDGKGIESHFTGDNQAFCAKAQGLAGVVVYGAARDIAGYRRTGIPLYCTCPTTRDKPDGFKVVAYNVPVEVGGAKVNPGDLIVADEDGVVVVPVDSLETVIANVLTVESVETDMEKALNATAPLEEISSILARKKRKSKSWK